MMVSQLLGIGSFIYLSTSSEMDIFPHSIWTMIHSAMYLLSEDTIGEELIATRLTKMFILEEKTEAKLSIMTATEFLESTEEEKLMKSFSVLNLKDLELL
jgi:hypothetical protein